MEQFCITSPHDNLSWNMFHRMIENAENFYRVSIKTCIYEFNDVFRIENTLF